MEVDVIVVGSGAGGLMTALVSAKRGLDVLVLESTPFFGGTTAWSGGGVWAPGNHLMGALGFNDAREGVLTYLRATLGTHFDAVKVQAYLDAAPAMLEFLENSGVRFHAAPIPDYIPSAPGWGRGRCVLPADYDGTQLGSLFARLRPIPSELGLFHSFQLSGGDMVKMQRWNKSLSAFLFTTRRLIQYAWSRLVHGRGTHLTGGNALAASLLKSVDDVGARLWTEAPARQLVMEGDRVAGVVVERNGVKETIRARKAVIVASGGFGANPEMRRRYLPQADYGWSLQPEGSKGEGISIAIAAGAVLNESNSENGIWAPISVFKREDGRLAKFPSLLFDRHCPGSIMVDARTGKRFVNEGLSYSHFGRVVQAKGITKVWMISDRRAIRKYGIGAVKPWPFPVRPWVRSGYVVEAPTVGELARKIGIDHEALEATVAEFNRHADRGEDPEFGRGQDFYSAFMGDARHQPNPGLGALRKAPFYALELRPGELSTLAGLVTNANGQVLNRKGEPIKGLYAAGLDNNAMMAGLQPAGGINLGHALTFGYISGRHIAADGTPSSRNRDDEYTELAAVDR